MIEYFSLSIGFYAGALIWQYRTREGLYIYDLFLFAIAALVWPVIIVVVIIAWLDSRDWMFKKIGGRRD